MESSPEKFLTARQISLLYDGTIAESHVRAATRRDKNHHPLPHVKFGTTRPIVKIRPSVFEQWLYEEMGINEAVEAMDTRAGLNPSGTRS